MNYNRVSYGRRYHGRGMAERVVFNKLNDIDEMLTNLKNKIDNNGYATLADYYELVGATVLPDDSKWGWNNLLETNIVLTRLGYELSMPITICVNRDYIQEARGILECAGEEDAYDSVIAARDCLSKVL